MRVGRDTNLFVFLCPTISTLPRGTLMLVVSLVNLSHVTFDRSAALRSYPSRSTSACKCTRVHERTAARLSAYTLSVGGYFWLFRSPLFLRGTERSSLICILIKVESHKKKIILELRQCRASLKLTSDHFLIEYSSLLSKLIVDFVIFFVSLSIYESVRSTISLLLLDPVDR